MLHVGSFILWATQYLSNLSSHLHSSAEITSEFALSCRQEVSCHGKGIGLPGKDYHNFNFLFPASRRGSRPPGWMLKIQDGADNPEPFAAVNNADSM